MIVGSNCVHQFKSVIEKLGHKIKIIYPKKLDNIANTINKRYPYTVEIIDFSVGPYIYKYEKVVEYDDNFIEPFFEEEFMSIDDLAPEGMGLEEFDWDSFDFEPNDDWELLRILLSLVYNKDYLN